MTEVQGSLRCGTCGETNLRILRFTPADADAPGGGAPPHVYYHCFDCGSEGETPVEAGWTPPPDTPQGPPLG
ncbi:hypothetical protein ACFOWE_17710 [Planomonospora corallina]|uniref:Small CPxCG-related zinc finger protein n=1 Tax=Planomonospora corallina TaxID=1806052 RepID=A0ABV8IB25_9ACTN